jgi:phosphoribosyl-AMP cyclohydrolase
MVEMLTPRYDERGLVPAIVQDAVTGQVLMLAWMNAEALRLTLETREAHFWSRSRQELWRKGATSGNVLRVVTVAIDCDEDALLVRAHPAGPACHTGNVSCFYRGVERDNAEKIRDNAEEERDHAEVAEEDEFTKKNTEITGRNDIE